IPPPEGNDDEPLKALIFDSLYDPYRGVIAYVCVKEGQLKVGENIKMMANGKEYEVQEAGVFTPNVVNKDVLTVGDVGFITASIKEVKDTQVGDTITTAEAGATTPLPGYKTLNLMVYCVLDLVNAEYYYPLLDAFEHLVLNDSSLQYEVESFHALGFGFRIGFLGLLHMEIIQERID